MPLDAIDSRNRSWLSAYAALLARIQRRYAMAPLKVSFGALEVELWRAADPERVLVQSVAAEAELGPQEAAIQPYWAEAWESAVVAGHRLAEADLQGLEVLDLGCGLGLAGIVAAARGARVVLADAVPAALLFARLNAWKWRDRVQVRRIDWRRDRLAQRFDLIIGADIFYQLDDWAYLDQFWRYHLGDGGQLLLTEPSRMSADELGSWLIAHGWDVRCSAKPSSQPRRPIRIYECSRHTPCGGEA